ncbi:hypothetical protein SUGI_0210350 [Cryptomeria japonica]|uniref:probable calcium-binding protein CML44 n=1 Tax=Cryptomeria japonica TaxID=3369 RepID=UPI002408C9DF|nr:probable calcium-binding protein CML44 [Cryptomeria japonica]GLJ13332.1 hypothetical protein SUGI_0210350 [Cryptomeria japonica]
MALSSVPHEIRRLFDTLDENGDGTLTLHEISCFLNKLGIQLTEDELKCLVMGVSHTQDGSLTFDEFVGLYQSVLHESSTSTSTDSNGESQDLCLMEAFKVYDLNEDGYISSSELHQVLCNLGLIERAENCLEDCQRMIRRYDENLDGLIDFSEFKNMMTIKPNDVHL